MKNKKNIESEMKGTFVEIIKERSLHMLIAKPVILRLSDKLCIEKENAH